MEPNFGLKLKKKDMTESYKTRILCLHAQSDHHSAGKNITESLVQEEGVNNTYEIIKSL